MIESVLIAGGNSFIGINLVLKLIELKKYKITVLIRPEISRNDRIFSLFDTIEIVELDLHNYDQIHHYVNKCDCYIPFTWNGTKSCDRNDEIKNDFSFRKILESIKCVIRYCNCQKIIYPGSFSEYGPIGGVLTEDRICEPVLAYGKYKYHLVKESILWCKQENVKFIEIRLFSIFGPYDDSQKMLYSVIKKMKNNEMIALNEGSQIWDFIYISDVVNAFLVMLNEDVESGTYNVTTMSRKSLQNYMERLKKFLNSESELHFNVKSLADKNADILCDNTKIMRETTWKSEIEFEEGIKKLLMY